MAFSFTYSKFFRSGDFHRTWFGRESGDRVLLFASWFGAALVHLLAAIAAWEFPPSSKLLEPVIAIGRFEFLPVSFLIAVILFLLAWVSDEYPRLSRRLIIACCAISTLVYLALVFVDSHTLLDTRALFVLYLAAMGFLAGMQLRHLAADSTEHVA